MIGAGAGFGWGIYLTHSTKEIARLGRITELTLKDYNKTILRKAREFFGEKTIFRSARNVAEFMRHSQLISLA